MEVRPVTVDDLEMMRLARNKWQKLGLFRQEHDITQAEQINWFNKESNPGFIINNSAYGKVYDDHEISFYGFDNWNLIDLVTFMKYMDKELYYGECYQNNPFLVPLWLKAGFKVQYGMTNRKYWNNRMWDSLMLKWSKDDNS